MKRGSLFLFPVVIALLCMAERTAWALHASVSSVMGHGGPITTIAAETLSRGAAHLGIQAEYQKFDTFSDSKLLDLAEGGEEGIHNVDSLLNVSLGAAFGITDEITFHIQVPYMIRNNISEVHHEEQGHDEDGHEVERRGDARGFGDLTATVHYRVPFLSGRDVTSALLLGLKMPTGKTGDNDDNGETFEAESQPGSGSWDPQFGMAFSRKFGRVSLDANVLYTIVTEGTQDTDLGDAFAYNGAVTYRVMAGNAALDLVLEANGIWKDKQDIDGEKDVNSGGTTIFLSPGIRVHAFDRAMAFFSLGFPLIEDLNGEQNGVSYRAVTGLNIHL